MNNMELKCYLSAKLRNLKRKNAKLSQHPELTEEYFEIEKEIEEIQAQITNLQ